MISRKSQLLEIFHELNGLNLQQKRRDVLYQQVISIRKTTPNSFDSIGFNLLHWAVLSNQPHTEIQNLIKTESININQGTDFVEDIPSFNITPLHFAVQIGDENMAKLLLDNGADKNIRSSIYQKLEGPIAGVDCSYTYKTENAAQNALSRGNATFKLFEKQFLGQYRKERTKDKRTFHSILPNCVASLFHYSQQQKLDAEAAYENIINREQKNSTWKSELKNLKNQHPAVDDSKLGKIYNASLRSRGI